jgi:Cu2+-containing amine oxidase
MWLSVCAQEPAKADLLAFEAGTSPPPPRCAFVVVQVPEVPTAYELVVDLGAAAVVSSQQVSSKAAANTSLCGCMAAAGSIC